MDCLEVYIAPVQGQVDVSHDLFSKVLKRVKRAPFNGLSKPFVKLVHKKYYEEQILEQTFTPPEYKMATRETTYSLTEVPLDDPLFNTVNRNETVAIHYKKKKFNLSQFPSTHQTYDCACEHKTIFKINNRTYLNFVETQYMSDKAKTYYTIMINYTDCVNSDRTLHSQSINELLDSFIDLVKTV